MKKPKSGKFGAWLMPAAGIIVLCPESDIRRGPQGYLIYLVILPSSNSDELEENERSHILWASKRPTEKSEGRAGQVNGLPLILPL